MNSPRGISICVFGSMLATGSVAAQSALPSKGMPRASTPDDLLARVSAGLRLEEYRFSSVEQDRWSAPNRAQGLRSQVDREGLQVSSRATDETDAGGDGAAWKLHLATAGFGRAGDAQAIPCRAVALVGEGV